MRIEPVPRLGLGTAALGNMFSAVADVDCAQVLERALELGINYIDTAPMYGMGLAERRIGDFLSRASVRRPLLSTKVGRLLIAAEHGPYSESSRRLFVDTPPYSTMFDFSYVGALRSLESSLERLAVDNIDIVFLHDPGGHCAEASQGAYKALVELRDAGAIRAIGVGTKDLRALTHFVRHRSVPDVVLVAGRYTLLDQSAGEALLPMCAERNVRVVVGSVLNSGVLASPTADARYDYQRASGSVVRRVRGLAEICSRYSVPLTSVALQFPLMHPAVSGVLIGPRTVDEMEDDVRAFDLHIPQELWLELERERSGSAEGFGGSGDPP